MKTRNQKKPHGLRRVEVSGTDGRQRANRMKKTDFKKEKRKIKMEDGTKQVLSTLSLVAGIIGFFIYGIILGIAAIIMGALSWDKGLGKAGVIIGIIDIIGLILILPYL